MTDLPVNVVRGLADVSNLTTVLAPNRPLTREERAVYRELAAEWAVLDAKTQLALYATLLDGRLADFLSSVFVQTATAVCGREDGITHPGVKHLAAEFHKSVLQEHAGHQLGFYRIAGEQFARQLGRDITPLPPLRPNRWLQLLSGNE